MRNRFVFVLILLINFTVAKAAFADHYIEEKILTTISGKDFFGVKKTYITEKRALILDPTLPLRQIFDFEQKKVYLVNDRNRTLQTLDLNEFNAPFNEKIYSEFASLKDHDFYCKESGIKKKIGKYNCSELVVYIPRISAYTRLWLSTEVEADLSSNFGFLKSTQDILSKKVISLQNDEKLCIVESKTLIVRPKEPQRYLKTTLMKVASQDVPEKLFTLPVDYTVIRNEVAESEDDASGSKE
ncbi:MAG: hypothetical protein JW864_02765 [Spirochaetes bacterium]|nr:hypothetical protein [Spirochaetota bacterium]